MSTPERALPGPGDEFAGKYTIERVLGEGGMGVVYAATHRRIGQRVAIKVLQPELLKHAEVVARFEREARAAGQLRSKHAVRVVDVGELPGGEPFMVMEYLEGLDLGAELEARGALPIAESVDLVLQACAAMSEAHGRGIVHRDLKPSNLFLASEDGGRIVKVLDFGISKLDEGGSAVTATQATMGTPLYMSPEQLRSTKQVDLRADIWSLGIILHELLAGTPPFSGAPAAVGAAIVSDPVPDVRATRPDVPEELAAVIRRALEKDRELRYPSASAFAQALEPWASAPLSRELAPPSTIEPALRKHEAMAATLAAAPPTDGAWTQRAAAPRRTFAYAGVGIGIVVVGIGAALLARQGSIAPAIDGSSKSTPAATSPVATSPVAPTPAPPPSSEGAAPEPPETASAALPTANPTTPTRARGPAPKSTAPRPPPGNPNRL